MIRYCFALLLALAIPALAQAQDVRSPTRDEAASVNLGDSTIESRMTRVPLFAASVPQASRVLAGCLKLDTETGGTKIRRVLNTCMFPISVTATPGKPGAYGTKTCNAVEAPRTITLAAFENQSIGVIPVEPGQYSSSFYTYCFAEISKIGVSGATVLPADEATANALLATLWSGTRGLLQYERYEPDGSETRVVKGSRAAGACKTRFDAATVLDKDGAPIAIRTEIDWSIPTRIWNSSQVQREQFVMSKRIYIFPNDRDKYPDNPAIWFDDAAATLKASRAIAVLTSRCSGGMR